MMLPVMFSTVRDALRKNTDLSNGTLNETTASRTVAVRVTRKPGVAGRKIMVEERKEEMRRRGRREDVG